MMLRAVVLLLAANQLLVAAFTVPSTRARALGGRRLSSPSAARHALRMATSVRPDDYLQTLSGGGGAAGGDVLGTPAVGPRFRKGVKQVSTLGPASFDPAMIEKLFLAGTDVFRLNLSHRGEGLIDVARAIRTIEAKYEHPIGILVDLQGPKHRVGMFDEAVSLTRGQTFRFDLDTATAGCSQRAALPHPEVLAALKVGDPILLDDGKLRVEVTAKDESSGEAQWIETVVMNDAKLNSRKGFNLPATIVPGEALTPKDKEDLEFVMSDEFCAIGVDWLALSFVQQPADMEELRDLVGGRSPAKLLAKIEKPSAVTDLNAIVASCDGIMVARGDLGVEMPPEDVPIVQKEIIDTCRDLAKPVIVATQMLESMIDAPAPTRAECSDVSTAIFDGADAIMLSGESAAGKYPEESVSMQERLVTRVESSARHQAMLAALSPDLDGTDTDAIMSTAAHLARACGATAVLCLSTSGNSVRRLSRLRPGVPILALTPDIATARALTLHANVYPMVLDPDVIDAPRTESFYRLLEKGIEIANRKQLMRSTSDRMVCTAGLPFKMIGAANAIRVVEGGGLNCYGGQCLVDE